MKMISMREVRVMEAMFDDEPTVTDMQLYAAKWILKTRETRSLTRSATQGV